MEPAEADPSKDGVDGFAKRLEEIRSACSLSFQQAVGSMREALAAATPLISLEADFDQATGEQRLEVAAARDRWRFYADLHGTLAENAASMVFNAVDVALKEFSENIGATGQEMTGGLIVGRESTGLLELVRAVSNSARHRHEWSAESASDDHKNWSIATLSRRDIDILSRAVFRQAIAKLKIDAWIDLERELVAAVRSVAAGKRRSAS